MGCPFALLEFNRYNTHLLLQIFYLLLIIYQIVMAFLYLFLPAGDDTVEPRDFFTKDDNFSVILIHFLNFSSLLLVLTGKQLVIGRQFLQFLVENGSLRV